MILSISIKYKKKIKKKLMQFSTLECLQEFFQSFNKFDECYLSYSIGSKAIFKFFLDNNIKLIYSATSASLGNKGNDKNL